MNRLFPGCLHAALFPPWPSVAAFEASFVLFCFFSTVLSMTPCLHVHVFCGVVALFFRDSCFLCVVLPRTSDPSSSSSRGASVKSRLKARAEVFKKLPLHRSSISNGVLGLRFLPDPRPHFPRWYNHPRRRKGTSQRCVRTYMYWRICPEEIGFRPSLHNGILNRLHTHAGLHDQSPYLSLPFLYFPHSFLYFLLFFIPVVG